MSQLRGFAAAVAIATLCVSVARAADMPQLPPPLEPLPAPPLREIFTTGWYLRGDVGYRWPSLRSASTFTGATLTNSSVGKDYTASAGIGMKSSWFRSDIMVDYATPFKYTGTFLTPGDTTAKIQSTDVLLNAYADLGTWSRLTPYVGGGLGAAYVQTTDVISPGFTGLGSASRWNFAWALMGGVGWAVAPNFVVDVGYRYLNVGDAKSDSSSAGNVTFRNVASHEVRLGLRWSMDDLFDGR